MPRYFRLALVRRFIASLREEGVGTAFRKARTYTAMRMRNIAPSILGRGGQGQPTRDDAYLHGIWQELARKEAFHVAVAPAITEKRRQIALIGDLNLPQCRKYRVEQIAAFWEARGVAFEYAHYQDVPRATRILQRATHLMEYRLQTMPVTEMLRYEARRLKLPILYDLDDPLFSVSAYETYGNMNAVDPGLKAHFLSEAPKYLSMMNGADVLSVSTPGLAEHCAEYSVRPVHVRRNFADAETLADGATAMAEREKGDGLFRVAFASGSQGHEIDLAEIMEPLTAFITARPERRLMLIGHFDVTHLPEALAEQVDVVKFSTYGRYLSSLAGMDCAVMPLCDDVFNRCKSAVRVIDAASVGVPSVVGLVGDLRHVVRDGTTGMIARTPQDWQDALEAMAEDRGRAARVMGAAARQDLESRWSGSDAPHIIDPALLDWVAA